MSASAANNNDLESWKEVHQQLINAVLISKDAIAIQKAQRRFWLTELNANLTEAGRLTATSIWKRHAKKRGRTPGATKKKQQQQQQQLKLDAGGKPVKKRKYTKRKKAAEEAAAQGTGAGDDEDEDRDDDDDEEESSMPAAKKLRPSPGLNTPQTAEDAQEDGDDETEDEDDDEEDDEDDDMPEESFFSASSGAMVPSAAHSPPHDPHSYSSFLPGSSFMMQNSRGPSIMAPTAYAMPEPDESDDDTEEDDY